MRSSNLKYSVDAGNIGVIAAEEVTAQWPQATNVFCVEGEGWYKVTLTISNCWRGRVTGTRKLYTTSGKFIVGDLCYMFSGSDWTAFLEKTNYLSKHSDKHFSLDTGGDGGFLARVKFQKE